jgi:hypothetical protein
MGVLKCPEARLWRPGVEQVLRLYFHGDPAALDEARGREWVGDLEYRRQWRRQ